MDGVPKDKFRCLICFKVLSVKHRKRHEEMHLGVKRFSCQFCEKTFSRKERCQAHERTHYGVDETTTTTSLHYCSCSKSFGCSSDLEAHLSHWKSHSEVFPCNVCSQVYTSISQLNKHCIEMHTDDKAANCICQICFKSFSRPDHVRRHMSRIHPLAHSYVKMSSSSRRSGATPQDRLDEDDDQRSVTNAVAEGSHRKAPSKAQRDRKAHLVTEDQQQQTPLKLEAWGAKYLVWQHPRKPLNLIVHPVTDFAKTSK